MGAVENLIAGAVDLHCHSGPSPMPRRITHAEAARQADALGFRAIVVKCHYHDTTTDVLAMAPLLAGIRTEVFGGIALNSHVGGLNPHAVDRCLKMGGRVIWFPTISSTAHLCHAERDEHVRNHFQPMGMMRSDEISLFDETGDVRREVHKIIELAKEAGALISTGHLGPEPAKALAETAKSLGHDRLILSHPDFVSGLDTTQVAELAELGVVIEHELGMYHNEKIFPFQKLLEWIDLVGPERTSLASDLGQVGNPLPTEAYKGVIGRLLDSGVKEHDIRTMIVDNPRRLIGLAD